MKCLFLMLILIRPPIIIGVTNPFFTKTFQHWPHILRISDVKSDIEGNKNILKIKFFKKVLFLK